MQFQSHFSLPDERPYQRFFFFHNVVGKDQMAANSVPNRKISDLSQFKALADDLN